jgi:hypothetical protein
MTAACIEIGRSPGVTSKPSFINPVHMSPHTASDSQPAECWPLLPLEAQEAGSLPHRRMDDGGPGQYASPEQWCHQKLYCWSVCRLTRALSSRHVEPLLSLGVRSAALSAAVVLSEVGPRGRPGIGMPCALHWACTVLLLTLMLQVNSTEQAPVCDCRCPATARQAGGESSTSTACRVRCAPAISSSRQ